MSKAGWSMSDMCDVTKGIKHLHGRTVKARVGDQGASMMYSGGE